MRKIRWSVVCAIIMLGLMPLTVTAKEITQIVDGKKVTYVKGADNFIVLYDSSSSMGNKVGSGEQMSIDVEKMILTEKNASLPALDWQAGIYTFTPGYGPKAFKSYIPMQVYDKALFTETIENLPSKPKGNTLLQHGLVSLDPILAELSGQTIVYLFTDGQYTVNAGLPAPGAIAEDLTKKYNVCFYVIDTDDTTGGDVVVKSIADTSSCGKVLKFADLFGHPDTLTNPLFMGKGMVPPKPTGYSMGNILFDFDKATIKAAHHATLNKLAAFLKDNPSAKVSLVGYTDNFGSSAYNMKLSQRRATAVKTYLVEKLGINPNRITSAYFGQDNPASTNDTEEGRSLNRRVEAMITN